MWVINRKTCAGCTLQCARHLRLTLFPCQAQPIGKVESAHPVHQVINTNPTITGSSTYRPFPSQLPSCCSPLTPLLLLATAGGL
jgi:hypothetical protein